MEDEPFCSIFLFINSSSGGGIGNKILQHEVQKMEFDIFIDDGQLKKHIHVYFVDMNTKRDRAFKIAKKITDLGCKVIGVVCGGDGTIMWVISQLHKYSINPMKIPLAVIPLGTGNDFSQYLGWGNQKLTVTENGFRPLKKLIRCWLRAKQQEFDIWDIKAQVFEQGKFEKVNKQSQNEVVQGKTFSKSFCNYCSFGIDAKIGYSFDKHRTASRLGNLVVYGTMGLIRSATRTKTINNLVQKFSIDQGLGDQIIEAEPTVGLPKSHLKQQILSGQQSKAEVLQQGPKADKKLIFDCQNVSGDKSQGTSLKYTYYSLLFLNINSFMGGVTDIWQKAKQRQTNLQKSKFHQTSSRDGKIEVLCFSSSVGMALQRVIGGFATKIHQSGGPLHIEFKENKSNSKYRTYLQIDGQFLRVSHPKSILITKSYLSPTSRIKVLRRNAEDQLFFS